MERDESTFLQSLNSKKDKAFQDLFRMFYRSLVRFSEHYLKIREDAEDVVQKVFIALWEEDVYFTTLNSLRNFLYNSVKNASLNHLKHKDVEERYLSSFVWEDMVESDLDEKIMIEELYRLLFATIDKLPEKCREIFLLHLKGMSNQEIAEFLNLSVLTVKTQKNRAIHFLQERLGCLFPFLNLFIINLL